MNLLRACLPDAVHRHMANDANDCWARDVGYMQDVAVERSHMLMDAEVSVRIHACLCVAACAWLLVRLKQDSLASRPSSHPLRRSLCHPLPHAEHRTRAASAHRPPPCC